MATMQTNLRTFQDDMIRRFTSLNLATNRRLTELETHLTSTEQHSEMTTQHLQDLTEQICNRQEVDTLVSNKTDHLRNHHDTTINQLRTNLNTRSDALKVQFETQLTTGLNGLAAHFDTAIDRVIERLGTQSNARSDNLSAHFDNVINRLEARLNPALDNLRLDIGGNHTTVHRVEESCAGISDRMDALNEQIQDHVARTEALKLEVRAG